MQEEPVYRMYTRRLPWLPAAIIGSIFLLVGVGMTLAPRTTHPLKDVIAGGICMLMGASVVFYTLYFLLTPTPVLRLDSAGMTYRQFPFVKRRTRWEDVDSLKAITDVYIGRGARGRRPQLTVYITLTPNTLVAYGDRRRLLWRFDPDDLTRTPEEVVEQIRRFHPVDYDDQFTRLT